MREYLQAGTLIRFPDGECYEITGAPIGEGGGSLVYPAARWRRADGDGAQADVDESGYEPGYDSEKETGESLYAVKECFPVSPEYAFSRQPSGEIAPEPDSPGARAYLGAVQNMQLQERRVTEQIYKTGFRLTPVAASARQVELSFDKGDHFHPVRNTVTVMESLSGKGRSLKAYLSEQRQLPPGQAFHLISQVLFAVREVHEAGVLHLDIQDGNVFLKGSLADNSDIASLVDFGSARKMEEDGKCAPVADRVLFSTAGFSAPEMVFKNDGNLRLGPEADIYSVGCLLLLLLTGQRKNPRRLYAVKNGCYLTAFDFRRVKCPAHLRRRMQDILAGALAREPENRYHSCDEMLGDVQEFAEALKPYRSDLSQAVYDAFISYKHGEVDGAVARKLQESLENFRTSRTGSEKRIQRVFLDEGELAACSDFSLQIKEALKQAGWLIVICSPEAVKSRWVKEEIRTFLKYHDRSHVLAVITGGEPEDAIPEEIGSPDKVLAADARGGSLKEILKKLKKDTLLRIAAPVLGTTYDTLKQRHRAYRMQRAAAAAFGMLALFAMFTVYVLYQSARVNEQYQIARENQARYLSSISLELLAEGDRDKALLTALAVEPEEVSLGPVVPEQLYALNSALSSYQSGFSLSYAPEHVSSLETITKGAFSDDGAYYYALDGSGDVCVLSGEDGEELWRISAADLEDLAGEQLQSVYSKDVQEILPMEEGRAVLCMREYAVVIDVRKKAVQKTILFQDTFSYGGCACDGALLAYTSDDGSIHVYRLDTGEQEYALDLAGAFPYGTDVQVESLCFHPDGTALAAGLSWYSLSAEAASSEEASPEGTHGAGEETPLTAEVDGGLILWDLETGEVKTVSKEQTAKVFFADAVHLAAIHCEREQNLASDVWGSVAYSCHAALYDLEADSQIYQGEASLSLYVTNMGFTTGEVSLGGGTVPALLIWNRGNITVVNLKTGEAAAGLLYQSDVIGAAAYDTSRFFVALADGTVQLLSVTDVVMRTEILDLSGTAAQFFYHPGTGGLVLFSGGRLVFCSSKADPGMQKFYTEGSADSFYAEGIQYAEVGGQVYRVVATESELLIFGAGSEECLFSYRAQEGNRILNAGVGGAEGQFFAAFVEESGEETLTFVKADVLTGEIRIREDVTGYDTLSFGNIRSVVYSKEMDALFVERYEGVVRFDISGDSLIPDERAILAKQGLHQMELTGDGNYLVLAGYETDLEEYRIYSYCLADGSLEKLEFEEGVLESYAPELIIPGTDSSLVCLYDGGAALLVVDCESGQLQAEIPVDRGKEYTAAFFDQDRYLIYTAGDQVVLYDLQAQAVAHTYEAEYASFGLDVISDGDSRYFGLKDGSITENVLSGTGLNHQTLHIFYVDEEHNMYPFADVDYGYASFAGQEILYCQGGSYAFAPIYTYGELRERALEALDGRTLTQEERLEYFITE